MLGLHQFVLGLNHLGVHHGSLVLRCARVHHDGLGVDRLELGRLELVSFELDHLDHVGRVVVVNRDVGLG